MHANALNATFAALADPTRRALLARLAKGDAAVMELAAPFDMSLPAISRHLKVLERAGLITKARDAQWRPCRLAVAPLQGAADWIGQYRQFWEDRFDRLDAYLQVLQELQGSQNVQELQAPQKLPVKEKKRGRK